MTAATVSIGSEIYVVRNIVSSLSIATTPLQYNHAAGVAITKQVPLLRAHAKDLRVTKDGFEGKGDERTYWLEAQATTKGERTTTLARVVVAEGRVFWLLAACPEARFELCKADFEKILESFEAL